MRPEGGTGMQTVLMSGASGLLGRAIAQALRAKGLRILTLVRHAPERPDAVEWQPEANWVADTGALEGLDAAIHLSGANVSGKRWTLAYKRQMIESRVGSTRVLAEALAARRKKPAVLLTASAVGYYGDR